MLANFLRSPRLRTQLESYLQRPNKNWNSDCVVSSFLSSQVGEVCVVGVGGAAFRGGERASLPLWLRLFVAVSDSLPATAASSDYLEVLKAIN